jgi:rhamnogalacturonan acetylesterase
MVSTGNNDGTQGWGAYLAGRISLPVTNNAVAGRSARSFTREGRFTAMAANVKAGDYVVIEFGHNDGGSLTPTDNGRSDCSPSGTNQAVTCKTTYK